jgi:hypothetical protein
VVILSVWILDTVTVRDRSLTSVYGLSKNPMAIELLDSPRSLLRSKSLPVSQLRYRSRLDGAQAASKLELRSSP